MFCVITCTVRQLLRPIGYYRIKKTSHKPLNTKLHLYKLQFYFHFIIWNLDQKDILIGIILGSRTKFIFEVAIYWLPLYIIEGVGPIQYSVCFTITQYDIENMNIPSRIRSTFAKSTYKYWTNTSILKALVYATFLSSIRVLLIALNLSQTHSHTVFAIFGVFA